MKSVADVIGVARSNLAERAKHRQPQTVGRPPQPDEDLVAEIKDVIADLPTYATVGCTRSCADEPWRTAGRPRTTSGSMAS